MIDKLVGWKKITVPTPLRFCAPCGTLDKLLLDSRCAEATVSSGVIKSTTYFHNEQYTLPFDISISVDCTPVSLSSCMVTISQDNGFTNAQYFQNTSLTAFSSIAKSWGVRPYFFVTSKSSDILIPDYGVITVQREVSHQLLDCSFKEPITLPSPTLEYFEISLPNADLLRRRHFLSLLSQNHAFFSPPEEAIASNLHMLLLAGKSVSPLKNDLPGVELEVKFSVAEEEVFQQIYDYFSGSENRFFVQQQYPHILERGLVLYFVQTPSGPRKYISWGLEKITASDKSNSPPIAGRILERKENNSQISLEDFSEELLYGKIVRKKKKVFWISHELSGRIYHIAMDRCYHGAKRLVQLEIEYAGVTSVKKNSSPIAVRSELQEIQQLLLKRFPSLTVSTLRKQKWIGF